MTFRLIQLFVLLAAALPSAVLAQRPEFRSIKDDPALPRVLLIGDSISIGYTLGVRENLTGVANVHRPPKNCGPTTRGIELLDSWLGSGKWDVIHFNWGLHDLKYIDAGGKLAHPSKGQVQVPLDAYERNLGALVRRLKQTSARLVWASTTPVPDGARGRIRDDSVPFNEIALGVMRRERIPINDLHAFCSGQPNGFQKTRDVHFTAKGRAALAKRVAASIRSVLQRPNFLVILCDDLGYGDLSCYGSKNIETPHLDHLASQGLRLTACYAAAPVCSPSRAGLLTGRTPTRIGVYDWIPNGSVIHLRKEEMTVATLLQRSGYATGHFGKWHLNGALNQPTQPQPGDHGFDHWFSTQNNARPSHQDPGNFVRNGEPVGALKGYSCQIVAAEAIQWLKSARTDSRPFFGFVCFHEPHEPIASPPELVSRHKAAGKPGEALYYANVENMDRAVGSLMKALDDLGLAGNTLVFFTSDNGPETLNRYRGAWRSHGSPGPLRGMKLHLHEGGIRVPGIVRWPDRMRGGGSADAPICGLDLLPTLCELAGVAVPRDRTLDGASFAAMFGKQPWKRAAPLFWHYLKALGEPQAALRDGDWKLVGRADLSRKQAGASGSPESVEKLKRSRLVEYRLYDVRSDISESLDLSESRPDIFKKLSRQLARRYVEVISEAPRWKPAPSPLKK